MNNILKSILLIGLLVIVGQGIIQHETDRVTEKLQFVVCALAGISSADPIEDTVLRDDALWLVLSDRSKANIIVKASNVSKAKCLELVRYKSIVNDVNSLD